MHDFQLEVNIMFDYPTQVVWQKVEKANRYAKSTFSIGKCSLIICNTYSQC
jgi:hypothetical protein